MLAVATVAVILLVPQGATAVHAKSSRPGGERTAAPQQSAPVVASITPPSGPASGGTDVVIAGSGYTGVNKVTFVTDAGRVVAASSFIVDSDVQITASSPPLPAGTVVDVKVATATAESDIGASDRFTYHVGTWRPTGSLVTGRSHFTATFIFGPKCTGASPPSTCGKVLIAGGVYGGSSGLTATAELYDPQTGVSTPTASMDSCAGLSVTVPEARTSAPSSPSCVARSDHTATLLADGRVLVAGGIGDTGDLAAAELFVPWTNTWVAAPSLDSCAPPPPPPSVTQLVPTTHDPSCVARRNHTATLLKDGTVIFVGGWGSDSSQVGPLKGSQFGFLNGAGLTLSSTELFNPAGNGGAGDWQPGPRLAAGRASHTATLLNDGSVLVAGGEDQFTDSRNITKYLTVDSAEVFTPTTGQWTSVGHMSTSRWRHSATLLSDGRVLIAGGITDTAGTPTALAELYVPSKTGGAGTWNPTAPMSTARAGHTATRLASNEVLVVGGTSSSGPAELYVPGDRWMMTAPQASGRFAAAASPLPDGEVWVSGGDSEDVGVGGRTNATQDASGERFTLADARADLAITGVDPPSVPTFGGTVTVTGSGFFYPTTKVTFGGQPATSIKYLSDDRILAATPNGPQGRADLVVSTGTGAAGREFTRAPGAWNEASALGSPRLMHTATLLDGPECHAPTPPTYCGKVLVAGGASDTDLAGSSPSLSSSELYDPARGVWSRTGDMTTPRRGHTATLLESGKVLVAGGNIDRLHTTAATEIYDPGSGTWSSCGVGSATAGCPGPLIEARTGHTATLLGGPACRGSGRPGYCGKVLVAGGAQSGDDEPSLPTSELYDPATGLWLPTGPLQTSRVLQTATLLPTGKVLVAGGANAVGNTTTAGDAGFRVTVLASSELYDPALGVWVPTGSLSVPRFFHSATLLDRAPCGVDCGQVLAVGGTNAVTDTLVPLSDAELYDPAAPATVDGIPVLGGWHGAGSTHVGHAGHAATLLPDGKALVAGSGTLFNAGNDTSRSAEIFDPAAGPGLWREASNMFSQRGGFTATLLDGPNCRAGTPELYCGSVLASGGFYLIRTAGQAEASDWPLSASELYVSAPGISALSPAGGPSTRSATVVIAGTGFSGATAVIFGSARVSRFHVDSPTQITAASPVPSDGSVEVAVTNVDTHDGVVTGGGTSASIPVNAAAMFAYDGCDLPVGPGQISYPTRKYSLLGLPGGSRLRADSFLYSWFDLGAGTYSAQPPTAPLVPGHGYWAYFSCSRPFRLTGAGVTPTAQASFPLHAYHASMVGNPSSSSPATVSGQDFAATWDPGMNGGAGGYAISGYREPQVLNVALGAWVFSYRDTLIDVRAQAP